jgi:hypothetical protein
LNERTDGVTAIRAGQPVGGRIDVAAATNGRRAGLEFSSARSMLAATIFLLPAEP